ncbi:hydrolase [Streptomyces caelestis]|jgi:predicted enzyme related to lactoylglutathione lyase|uniref:Putative enzyme related to lactoylglutathione lyase n=2 Tax=Streptomyces caelestis TaxID=36816 RepID=A0A7W9HDA2_9ACTN|nr:putative enzyme related to lactoylglutathione lyase [Streptomyces caelestis]GGW82378.1 hydrolase [Streptomyces caelestis]
MFSDLEGAKSFYGDVLGWTFAEASTEFGNYTEACANGKAVAAVVPPMPGQEGQSQWCLYFAARDAAATAARIRDHGGEVLMEPMRVGDFGTMCLARDPGGVVFGVWQAGTHEGFDTMAEPGAYTWAEVVTHEPEKSDAFFPAVFSYQQKEMEDEEMDFRIYDLGDRSVLGRMKMTDDFPPEVPPYIDVYFAVEDCDDAVAKATKLGGVLRFGPMDTPFGRFASLSDPQGANFSVIDITRTEGEMPKMTDVS